MQLCRYWSMLFGFFSPVLSTKTTTSSQSQFFTPKCFQRLLLFQSSVLYLLLGAIISQRLNSCRQTIASSHCVRHVLRKKASRCLSRRLKIEYCERHQLASTQFAL